MIYNNAPVGVRSNATQLELWQWTWDTRGVIARAKIIAYIAQDGSYSVRLFDGDYKIVRLAGAPWSNPNTDTLLVTVKGNTTFDVPVTPYFIVTGESYVYSKSDSTITATGLITKVGSNAITNMTLYAGITSIVDNTNSIGNTALTTGLVDLSTPKTAIYKLTKANFTTINTKTYVYARLAVQITGVSERYFTQVRKISLQ
jgi:Fe-S cluster assembly scaffold protein SufB